MIPLRIEEKIERVTESGCWIWLGHITPKGYAHGSLNGKKYQAHRFIYVLVRGPIPDDMQLDHLCRVRCCVNPYHLEAVTCRTNLLRGYTLAAQNAAKTHCVRGHEYTDNNTYRFKQNGSTKRVCRQCQTARQKQNQRRSRDES